MGDGFKMDKKEEKSTTVSNLPSNLCPIRAELELELSRLKNKGD
jgi:hypothetical protein